MAQANDSVLVAGNGLGVGGFEGFHVGDVDALACGQVNKASGQLVGISSQVRADGEGGSAALHLVEVLVVAIAWMWQDAKPLCFPERAHGDFGMGTAQVPPPVCAKQVA